MARKLPQGEAFIFLKANPAVTKLVFTAESCHARHLRRVLGSKQADKHLPDATIDESLLEEVPPSDWF